MIKITIELTSDSNLLMGKLLGEESRELHMLDMLDDLELPVKVFIPKGTFAMTNSYFKALFEKSIIKAGSKKAFFQKYRFRCSDHILDSIEPCIDEIILKSKISYPETNNAIEHKVKKSMLRDINLIKSILDKFR